MFQDVRIFFPGGGSFGDFCSDVVRFLKIRLQGGNLIFCGLCCGCFLSFGKLRFRVRDVEVIVLCPRDVLSGFLVFREQAVVGYRLTGFQTCFPVAFFRDIRNSFDILSAVFVFPKDFQVGLRRCIDDLSVDYRALFSFDVTRFKIRIRKYVVLFVHNEHFSLPPLRDPPPCIDG